MFLGHSPLVNVTVYVLGRPKKTARWQKLTICALAEMKSAIILMQYRGHVVFCQHSSVVEQLIRNEQVLGSNPSAGSSLKPPNSNKLGGFFYF